MYGGVSRRPAQQVRRGEDGEALALQLGRDGVPAGPVGPCSVDQDDRGLRHVCLHVLSGGLVGPGGGLASACANSSAARNGMAHRAPAEKRMGPAVHEELAGRCSI